MDFSLLSRQNPWWSSRRLVEEDFVLTTFDAQAVKWTPRLFHRFRLDRDRVFTLRGPRQVGKTTLVKMLVRRLLLEEHADPRAVFYYSCDLIRDAKELDDLVESYLRWQEPFGLRRRYLFLDEVSSIRDWSVAFRALANRGRLRAVTTILTGSHALDIVRQVERLPGRRGESSEAAGGDLLDKILLPMKFAEFSETIRPDIRNELKRTALLEPETRLATFEGLFGSAPSQTWSSVLVLQSRLDPLLADYLVTGGFPRPLNDFKRTGRISPETYDLYVRVLTGDLARWGHSERTSRELLAAIVEKMGTPISWRTLADEVDVGSHNTVSKYVETLEKTFTLQTVYQYDPRRKRPAPRKERKLYVADPFMFHAIRNWALGLADPFRSAQEFVQDPRTRGSLLEAIIANHLARLAFAAKPTSLFDAFEHVMFWRSRRGWEVDFVVRLDTRPRAIQVTTSRSRTETTRALRAFGGGIVLTQTGGGTALPIAPFLLTI